MSSRPFCLKRLAGSPGAYLMSCTFTFSLLYHYTPLSHPNLFLEHTMGSHVRPPCLFSSSTFCLKCPLLPPFSPRQNPLLVRASSMNPRPLGRVDLPSAGLRKHITNFHNVNFHLEIITTPQVFKHENRSCPTLV